MAKHTTTADLQNIVNRINRMTNSPQTSWKTVDGKNQSNVGNYHLDFAYGGVSLKRMSNTSGSCSDVLRIGYVSNGHLKDAMFAFIEGIYAGQEAAEQAAKGK